MINFIEINFSISKGVLKTTWLDQETLPKTTDDWLFGKSVGARSFHHSIITILDSIIGVVSFTDSEKEKEKIILKIKTN